MGGCRRGRGALAPRPAPALPPCLPGTQPASGSVGDPARWHRQRSSRGTVSPLRALLGQRHPRMVGTESVRPSAPVPRLSFPHRAEGPGGRIPGLPLKDGEHWVAFAGHAGHYPCGMLTQRELRRSSRVLGPYRAPAGMAATCSRHVLAATAARGLRSPASPGAGPCSRPVPGDARGPGAASHLNGAGSGRKGQGMEINAPAFVSSCPLAGLFYSGSLNMYILLHALLQY